MEQSGKWHGALRLARSLALTNLSQKFSERCNNRQKVQQLKDLASEVIRSATLELLEVLWGDTSLGEIKRNLLPIHLNV